MSQRESDPETSELLLELHTRYTTLESTVESAINNLRGAYRPGSKGVYVADQLAETLEAPTPDFLGSETIHVVVGEGGELQRAFTDRDDAETLAKQWRTGPMNARVSVEAVELSSGQSVDEVNDAE